MEDITISIFEYIGLLELKLLYLKKLKEEGDSWNYDIDELEQKITELKTRIYE